MLYSRIGLVLLFSMVLCGLSPALHAASTSSEAMSIKQQQLRDYKKLDPANNDYFGLLDPRDARALHQKIIQAIDRGDLQRAKQLRSKFVERYKNNYMQDPYYTQAHDDITTHSWNGITNGF